MGKNIPRITGHPEWVTTMQAKGQKARVQIISGVSIDGNAHKKGERLRLEPTIAFEVVRSGRGELLSKI